MSRDFGASALSRITDLERKGATLTVAQKILLAEVGTVEQVLSILTCSPISVKVGAQTEKNGVIERETVLTSDSGEPLIRARSRVHCKNLPRAVVARIRRKKTGIGTVIFVARIETFRKITKMGIKDGVPYRTYKIFYGGKVAFEIREEVLLRGGPGGI